MQPFESADSSAASNSGTFEDFKLAFDAQGAGISALLYVEIHEGSCKLERMSSQRGERLLHSVYRD